MKIHELLNTLNTLPPETEVMVEGETQEPWQIHKIIRFGSDKCILITPNETTEGEIIHESKEAQVKAILMLYVTDLIRKKTSKQKADSLRHYTEEIMEIFE